MNGEQIIQWIGPIVALGWVVVREWRKRSDERLRREEPLFPVDDKEEEVTGEDEGGREKVVERVAGLTAENCCQEEGGCELREEISDVSAVSAGGIDLRTMVIANELLKPKWREDD